MSGGEPTLPGKVIAISEALGKRRIRHAFGGALALAYYARPRATADIDLNVFLPPASFTRVAELLAPLGVDTKVDQSSLMRSAQCRLRWGRTPIDLFLEDLELHRSMRSKLRRVPFADSRINVLAPEHLITCKVAYDRPKDWLDIEQIALTLPELEIDEVVRCAAELLGAEDPRVKRLTHLLAPFA